MPSISERLKPFIGIGDLSTSAYEYKFKKKHFEIAVRITLIDWFILI